MTNPQLVAAEQSRAANSQLWVWFVVAIIVGTIGAFIAIYNWPSVTIESNDVSLFSSQSPYTRVHHGDQGAANIGLVLVGIANLLGFVSLVGYGVKLGIRAAR